jgi:hypothetical protein
VNRICVNRDTLQHPWVANAAAPGIPPEEEIRMLEAMKTVEKIRLDAIAQRIDVLRKMVKE